MQEERLMEGWPTQSDSGKAEGRVRLVAFVSWAASAIPGCGALSRDGRGQRCVRALGPWSHVSRRASALSLVLKCRGSRSQWTSYSSQPWIAFCGIEIDGLWSLPSSMMALPVLLAVAVSAVTAVDNGLARTPQMGWNNWNSLGCDVSESLLLETSEKLITYGLRDVGYKYVVLDDCWQDGRGEDGYIRYDEQKFPNGMKWVAEQIHNQGLLYGMYSSAGEMTCARFEGSLDHEVNDAKSFASWDVDYLKYDNCYHAGRFGTPQISSDRYRVMWNALNATGRPILYSLCNWGEDYVHTWGMSIANSWRMSGDIYDSFTRPDDLCACTVASDPHCIAPGSHCSVLNIVNKVAPYVDRGFPGGWNDLDMLEVGNGGMTDEEYKAHFSLWAALKSPLLIGADLRHLDPKALSILNNPAVIAISQDPLGRSVIRSRREIHQSKDEWGVGETHLWSGRLYGGDQVVLFLNAANDDLTMTASLAEIFLADGPGGSAPQIKDTWDVYDLWANRMDDKTAQKIIDAGLVRAGSWYNATELSYLEGLKQGDERLMGKKIETIQPSGSLKVKVPRHGVRMFRLKEVSDGSKKWRKSLARDEI